jgi:hypothetical protein
MSAVATTLLGVVETPTLSRNPYLIDSAGRPYLPVGEAGVVLGPRLGDGVFAFDADHAAPGVTLIHPDQPARHALTTFSCLGNEVVVRTGAAAGATGRVLGKRGEAGRVIAVFGSEVLRRLTPGDTMAVRAFGQGATLPADGVAMINVDPGLLSQLAAGTRVGVRGRLPSHLAGNGLGRPAQQWDIDLQLEPESAARHGVADVRLGDLLCVDDLDVRHNAGYRRGWLTVGVVVHGSSPLPGHGPGLMPILCGPAGAFDIAVEPAAHAGVTEDLLGVRDA